MGERKFIGYFKLTDAFGRPGCPVCRCVDDDSRGYLDALLYEQVTDPDMRRAIRASWGFCNWHTWMLLELENAIFGAAILYEDLVQLVLRRTEQLGGSQERRGWFATLMRRKRRPAVVEGYRGRAACSACATAVDTEHRCLETLVRFINDDNFRAACAGSDGLCVPHLLTAVEAHAAHPQVELLIELTREKWTSVGRDIASFVRKHDYRNREPYTEAEAASYRRAFEMLVGVQNVFGNDLHTSASIAGARRRLRPRRAGAPETNGNGVPSHAAQERTP